MAETVNNSILTSVKKILGITEEYTHFDPDIIIDINSVFSTLLQLGVGPENGYSITGKDEVWTDYMEAGPVLEMVKAYIPKKVRLMFDTSTMSSGMMEALKQQIAEDEWRLNVFVDPGKKPEPNPEGE